MMMVHGGRGGGELTVCGILVLIGRTIASVVGACDVAVVVVYAVCWWSVLGREVLVGVLNRVTAEIITLINLLF